MKRKLLITSASFIAVIFILLLVLPLVVDADRFRPMVQEQAQQALQRQVNIGKLGFSVWSGAVVAHDLSIQDDPAFSKAPFVRASALKIGVEVWPFLISREVHVRSLELQEAEINLVRSPSGKWNFDSLGARPATPKPRSTSKAAPTASAAPAISIAELLVTHGRITVLQQDSHGRGTSHAYQDVNVQLRDFSPGARSPFNVSAQAPGGGKLEIRGQAGPVDFGEVARTPLKANISVKGMDLAATGFLPAESIAGVLDYEGQAESDGKILHSEGQASIARLRAVKGGMPSRIPVVVDYASDIDLNRHNGALKKGDVKFGNASAKLTGDFDSRGDATTINARLYGQNMPVDSVEGLLPAFGIVLPSGSKLQGGAVTADLKLQGPLDRLVITGPINMTNTRVQGFDLRSRMSAISALAGMPSASNLAIDTMNTRLRVAPEGIRAEGIELVLPSIGSMRGQGFIGKDNSLDFKRRAKLANGGGLAGGVSQLTTLGQSKGEIPFLIQGTTSNPVFAPDLGAAVSDTIKAPVNSVQGVGGILGGLFGKKKKN
jgi:AsmA protein